jgi:hypothetical protein
MRFVLAFLLLPVSSMAELSLSGQSAIDARVFLEGAPNPGQREGSGLSLLLEPEAVWTLENGDEVAFKPFVRLDPQEDARTHGDIRELFWLRSKDTYEVLAGFQKVFWGRAESNHLVDIINQTDTVESFDEEQKLGQPMVQLASLQTWGTVRLFILPAFRERTFPGKEGRLRTGKPVDGNRATYASGAGQWRTDVALRYEHSWGDWDMGLAYFNGTDRAPVLREDGERFVPYYDVIDQASLDLQYTRDAWLWKLEALARSGEGERFSAFVAGFEYTFFGIQDTAADLGILFEYHRDDRGVDAPATLFDDDVFVGARLALNDVPDTQFLAGVVADRYKDEQSYFVEASRRLNNNYKVELEARFFSGRQTPLAAAFRTEDFIQLRLVRFF